MADIERLPSLPLIANDPYFSYWMPADTLNGAVPEHWTGAPKPMTGFLTVDGIEYSWLGQTSRRRMETVSLHVTPTRTVSTLTAGGVSLTVCFWSPALPDDLDALSTPITFVDFSLNATDGKTHQVKLLLSLSSALCRDGETEKFMSHALLSLDGMQAAYVGQSQQHVLGNCGDHITIDWGYLWLAAKEGISVNAHDSLEYRLTQELTPDTPMQAYVLLGYDDIASINYFGVCCRAWYQRNGRTLAQALVDFNMRHDALLAACEALDARVMNEARAVGGEDYAQICSAAWRHTFAAHKLIATPEGEMVLLSKENDSNGCIGTVDVSYPSIPLFLKYCPELVNALCRPVLYFASLPVWEFDFAPHDVGRYPYATGQVYAAAHTPNGLTPPPYYMYPAGTGVYSMRSQMPVEECGNMLIMLAAAIAYGAKDDLLKKYTPALEKWVKYLDQYGEDPGEQLCTDDFAGHLAHNVNLSAKAVVGVACYARLMAWLGRDEDVGRWQARAHELAQGWLHRVQRAEGTPLTFDGMGWSMKYNLVWDLILELNLLPAGFYREESCSYLPRMNTYGLPLDSRADYTKSDWILWTACLAQDVDTLRAIIAPVARYLRETPSRVPFSDWYDTKTGAYIHFIGRSVQGGIYMPLLRWKTQV